MGKYGLVLVMFLLAVGLSLGISYFLWEQPDNIGGTSGSHTEIEELRTEVIALRGQLGNITGRQSELPFLDEDFEILATRLNALEDKVSRLSAGKPGGSTSSSPGTEGSAPSATEETVRQVLQDIEEEKRRKEEEDRQRRREQRQKETQEWLEGVYNERLALLTKELSLTANQEEGVRQALEARRDSVLKVYASYRMSEEERRGSAVPSWDDINQGYDTSIKQVLNQEQYKIYKDKGLDDFNRGRGRGRGRRSSR